MTYTSLFSLALKATLATRIDDLKLAGLIGSNYLSVRLNRSTFLMSLFISEGVRQLSSSAS